VTSTLATAGAGSSARLSRRKDMILSLATSIVSIVLFLGLAEIVLQFLPVQSPLRTMPVTAENPVFHFEPNGTNTFSRGWNFELVNRRRINNGGWMNDQDYRKDDSTPLLAVVGDSYIEAAIVPYAETLYARLADTFQSKLRVYSFGASGAPLSQYLVWARHAVREYGAKAVVINVVGNDFDESHIKYNTGPGWWIYAPDADGKLDLRLVEFRPGWFKSALYRSSLARYVFFHLEFAPLWRQFTSFLFGPPAMAEPAPRYAGNTSVDTSPTRVRDSLAVMDAFLRDLPTAVGLTPDRVTFTLDGFRYPDIAAANGSSYFAQMRWTFASKAAALGYEVIDLDPWFFAHLARRADRFEHPRDGHWNSIAHGVAADALMASKLLSRLRQ
jgi:hypothetical protein